MSRRDKRRLIFVRKEYCVVGFNNVASQSTRRLEKKRKKKFKATLVPEGLRSQAASGGERLHSHLQEAISGW